MACFIAPAAEAVVTTAVTKIVEKKEMQKMDSVSMDAEVTERKEQTPFSRKLKWLDYMLWGGSALLLLEHIWHGEISLFFPFFTAAATPAGLAAMLTEIFTVGVAMAAFVTVVWAGMVVASTVIEKRREEEPQRVQAVS